MKRPLTGTSDMSMEPRQIGFGLGKIHHVFSSSERERIVHGALDAGFHHFDLASAYGDGLCEAEAGRILQKSRHKVTFATKFGINTSSLGGRNIPLYFASKALRKVFSPSYGKEYALRDFSPAAATFGLERSLKRLRTDYIDYFFLHEPRNEADLDNLPELIGALERLKQAGKIRHYGVSATTGHFLNSSRPLTGDLVQFELSDRSPAIMQTLSPGVSSSAFGIVRHLAKTRLDGQRLDYDEVLRWFYQHYPSSMPIFASNRPREIAKLGRAAAELAYC